MRCSNCGGAPLAGIAVTRPATRLLARPSMAAAVAANGRRLIALLRSDPEAAVYRAGGFTGGSFSPDRTRRL
ncbi:hypothetical protein GCM10009745_43820 [Kribbella yunnanensis]|uniref:Uncharacterized protein n=1 Tax=Kribbella yunnanensis TaxID=190194 RepID=A0ABP4TTN0_9ACTN